MTDDFYFRYFFHATDARTATNEYNMGMDTDEDDAREPEAGHAGPSGAFHSDEEDQPMHLLEENEVIPKVEEEELDPGLADWFQVDNKNDALPAENDAEEDSVTEDDSDHAGVTREAEEEVDLDDWFQVKTEDAAEGSISKTEAEMQPKVHFISSYIPTDVKVWFSG
jgi:DNA ligase-4